MVAPRLLLQLPRGEVLLVRTLLVIEDEEERIRVELVEGRRRVEHGSRSLGEGVWRRVGIARHICPRPLRVARLRLVQQRHGQEVPRHHLVVQHTIRVTPIREVGR